MKGEKALLLMQKVMDRRGVVVDVKKDGVIVLLHRHEACGSCSSCSLGREDGKETLVEAKNVASAKKGDFVELNIASSKIVKAALSAYGIPLLLMITVLIFGYYFRLSEKNVLFGIGLSLLISYYINKAYLEPKRMKENSYEVVASKIVNSLEEACDE